MPRTRNILLAIAIAIALAVSTTSPAALAAVPRATLGAAFAQGNISLFRTAQSNGLHLVWAREFWAGSVPDSLSAWPAAAQAHQLGLKLWLSVDVGPDALAAGNYDDQLARFARTLPPGTRLTFMHEPSVKTKHYTPARFVAGFEHAAQVVRRVAPLVLTGPIDVRFNILTGHFMDNLNPALVDFVGVDGYDGINGGPPGQEFARLVEQQVAFLQGRFPHAPVGFAEFNTSRSASDRPRWIADAMAWGRAHNVEPMCVFAAAGPYVLSAAEQQTLAKILNAP